MKAKNIFAVAALAVILTVPAAAQDLWLHVKVDDGGERVSVNMPLSIIEKALPMIPKDAIEASRIAFDETEMTVADLRELWAEIKSQPDFTMVTVEGDDENVHVKKAGDYLLVDVVEGEETNVNVRIPVSVVDALLTGEGDQLNLEAAIGALAAHGEGDLVTVNENDERVHVWVDSSSEAR